MSKLARLLACCFVAGLIRAAHAQDESPKPDIFYLPTPQRIVDVMLLMADVNKDDVVYDLRSGDGRLVITAARRYGARGVGIEIDPKLIAYAKKRAARLKVEEKVEFRQQDLFKTDLKEASVITLYLLDTLNVRLRPQIFARVKPGTRIVSHAFHMGEWQPDAERKLTIRGKPYEAYFWVVPANISGRWKLSGKHSIRGLPDDVVIEQRFQDFTVHAPDSDALLASGKLAGTEFYLIIPAGERGIATRFTGTVDGDEMKALLPEEALSWRGTRVRGTEKPLEPPE